MAHDKYYTEQALLYAYGELDKTKEKLFLVSLFPKVFQIR